jgi:hypothetical protein
MMMGMFVVMAARIRLAHVAPSEVPQDQSGLHRVFTVESSMPCGIARNNLPLAG